MFVCPFCKDTLKTKNEYIKHMDGHSTGSKKDYPCPICNIFIHNRKSFYKHMECHENKPAEESQQILCRHCQNTFTSISDIENHLETLGPKIFCPFCQSKPSSSMNAYRVHKHR